MIINRFLEQIFGEDIKWHCRDLNSKAMVEFNVACPLAMPFSLPIIDVKKVSVSPETLGHTHKSYEGKDDVEFVALITSYDDCDKDKCLTVNEIIEKFKTFDKDLEVCQLDKEHKKNLVSVIINVWDGTNNTECERKNFPKDYNGTITYFVY